MFCRCEFVSHACHHKDESLPFQTDLGSVFEGMPLSLGKCYLVCQKSRKSQFVKRSSSVTGMNLTVILEWQNTEFKYLNAGLKMCATHTR